MVLLKEKGNPQSLLIFWTTQELNSSWAPNDDFLLNAMKKHSLENPEYFKIFTNTYSN